MHIPLFVNYLIKVKLILIIVVLKKKIYKTSFKLKFNTKDKKEKFQFF